MLQPLGLCTKGYCETGAQDVPLSSGLGLSFLNLVFAATDERDVSLILWRSLNQVQA